MSTCTNILPRLTAYLDGELPGDEGSVVRGHLRECAECRQVARDEAALRDGLRQLVPVDPPASLWAGVQAQLAVAEVADAHTPWWRRAWRRWTPAMPSIRQVAAGSLLAAAAVLALSLHARRRDEVPVQVVTAPAPVAAPAAKVSVPAAEDVTADLLAEPARTTARYDQVIEELMKLASEARPTWSDERKAAFETRVAELKTNLDQVAGAEPRRQQRIQRIWIRYLQDAVVRDDVVLASGGAR